MATLFSSDNVSGMFHFSSGGIIHHVLWQKPCEGLSEPSKLLLGNLCKGGF
jgi:hypothetical protein